LALFCSVLFSINLVLGCFNLLPLPPLDGYAIVPLVLNERMRDKWFGLFSGGGVWMGLIIAWVVFDRLMPPVFRTAIGWLYAGI
jgi:Zn-dependent protease